MISIIIPTYNEEEILEDSINLLIEYLTHLSLPYEIIVVDNGSTDKTLNICEKLKDSLDYFKFFSLKERGVGKAFILGIKEAKYDYCISIDADLSSEIGFIKDAATLLEHADMVIGSKTMGFQTRNIIRIFGSQLYVLIAQSIFKLPISDYSPDSKAYKKSEIIDILDSLDNWTAYVFEIVLWLSINHKKILQVGINCNDTRKSHFNLMHEGFFRYKHLFKIYRELKNEDSWFYKIK